MNNQKRIDVAYFEDKLEILLRDINCYHASSGDLARVLTRLAVTSDEQAVKAEMNIGWQPIETAPLDGKAVLVFYKDSLGNGQIIKAKYIKKHTEEACEEFVAIGFYDYCGETGEYYTPEGWYGLVDSSCDYSSYILDATNKPTHWQPLPLPPEDK